MLGGISIESTADDEQKERPGRGGRFPQIHTAMQNLRQAAQQLEKAENIYGGPRAKALDLAKQAEHELREAIEFARKHHPAPGAGKTPKAR